MTEPMSSLTRERPDIWRRAVDLATSLTGTIYEPKLPLADGTIYACGGWVPPPPIEEQIKKEEKYIEVVKKIIEEGGNWFESKSWWERHLQERLPILEQLKKRQGIATASVAIPDGAMEWLLHEVGHWVASTREERARPNYGLSASEVGHDGSREWQAWGFEEIVLAPFGPSRSFAPPTQRDGAAFSKAGPMPAFALDHAERQIRALAIEIEQWRSIWAEWVQWGARRAPGRAPWQASE